MFKDRKDRPICASLKMYPVPGHENSDRWINTQQEKIMSVKLFLKDAAENTASEIFNWMINNGFGASSKDTYIAQVALPQLSVKQKILLEKFNLTL